MIFLTKDTMEKYTDRYEETYDSDIERDAGEDENSMKGWTDGDENDSVLNGQTDDAKFHYVNETGSTVKYPRNLMEKLNTDVGDCPNSSEGEFDKDKYTDVCLLGPSEDKMNNKPYKGKSEQFTNKTNCSDSLNSCSKSNFPLKRSISRSREVRHVMFKAGDLFHQYRWRIGFLMCLVVIVIAVCLVVIVLLNHHDDLKLDHQDLLDSMRSEMEKQNANLTSQQIQITGLSEQMKKMARNYLNVQTQVDSLSSTVRGLEKKVDTNTRNLTDIRNVTEQQHNELTEQQNILSGLSDDIDKVEADVTAIQRQEADLKHNVQQIQSRVDFNDRKTTDISNDVRNMKGAIQTLQQKNDKQSHDLSGIQREVTQFKSDVKEIKSDIDYLHVVVHRNEQAAKDAEKKGKGGEMINRSTMLTLVTTFLGLCIVM